MNIELLKPEVQQFVNENLRADISALVLKGSPFPKITAAELATQIAGRKTAERKLPLWFENEHILYPPKLNLEQTSSQITAEYKASLISGKSLADLTGGFGIDSYFFSKKVEKLFYNEMNEDLAQTVKANFTALKAANIEVNVGDGLEFLRSKTPKIDWIFLDPARRDDHGGKVFRLSDCTPDVVKHLPLLFEKANRILIKTSPLLDLKLGISELKFVAEIHILAVENEVKELLWILKKDSTSAVKIITKNFSKKEDQSFETIFEEQDQPLYSLPENYLYEPNAAIMKSQLFGKLSNYFEVKKLHQHSHLFTSEENIDFPGRKFQITEVLAFGSKELKKKFKGKKANISTRNFPIDVLSIRKKYKIKDGGSDYLFFTTNLKEEKIVLVCEKS
ncbi:class I SAM-dependent methyltransferase [Zunongwangia endophytica]|uniref:Class I SAM-dependent methyltransferase n=1 Tax=Zunongwangia endophytica TaxID=1808945 RepID=A0ABV8HG46_9FLAO|nr:class I SAM-dependent methyltransferase [Zunongwangia endophytica]MDN3593984.1 class I SAM-dependent methyltransferase [Zunongwangia endophytica]